MPFASMQPSVILIPAVYYYSQSYFTAVMCGIEYIWKEP
jgi:hypothetical protein